MLVIGFLVVLGPLVFFHELGHFILAKLARIRVLEFGFGFPPRAFQFWQSKGRLALNGTPIVIPANFKDLPPSAAEFGPLVKRKNAPAPKPQGFLAKQFVAEETPEALGALDRGSPVDVVADQVDGVYVLRQLKPLQADKDNVSPVTETTAQGLHLRGELTEYVPGTIYSFNWLLPLGGFVRMLGEEDPTASDSFAAAPKRRRAGVLLAGPLTNILLAFLIFTGIGLYEPVTCRIEVTGVRDNTPAATAGLQAKDIILAVDGETLDRCGELGEYTYSHGGQQITLKVERNGQIVTVPLTPRAKGQYNPAVEGPIGISNINWPLSWTLRAGNLPEAMASAATLIVGMVAGILSLPVMLLSGAALTFMGPIGISQAGGEAIVMSYEVGTLIPILMLIGQVSVAIGLTNALPFPALDGGRLLFIVFEWIRGRRVDPRKEMIVHVVGLSLLLILVVLISYGDIVRLLSGQKLF
jgi:regulator of sigma E protease